MRGKPILALTGLRMVAAAAVFLDHWQILPQGAVGVSLFYCLSGFILTYNYAPVFRELRLDALRSYVGARVGRIWPVHLLGLGLVILYMVLRGHGTAVDPGRLAANVLLLQSWFHHASDYFSFNGVAWSMSDEIFFYALFPLLAFAALRLTRAGLWRLLGGVAVLALALPLYLNMAPYGYHVAVYYGFIFPPSRLLEFVAGMALGLLVRPGAVAKVTEHLRPGLRADAPLWLAGASILATAAAVAVLWPGQDVRLRTLFYVPSLLLLVYALSRPRLGPVGRLFSTPLMVELGKMSFAFYVLHQIVRRYWSFTHVPVPAAPMVFLITVAASFVVYRYLETPLRRILRSWIAGARAPARAAQVERRFGTSRL